ncbi:MAG TPA: beta-ketoacyl-ACP synthase III, partial [Polyangiales bacterium]|nr:beta-ketoacyl-ACP synthase III [Polyangiales bacterium]
FGIQQAANAVVAGGARCVLMVNPEITSPHLNFRDRDSHFIFGDVCTAAIIERAGDCVSQDAYEILSMKLLTHYSNTIRNNFGFMNHAEDDDLFADDKLFRQQGRKVFKDVVPMVVKLIGEHLEQNGLSARKLRRMWLHQANLNMNRVIMEKLLGREASDDEAPTILDEYANTASAGSIIVFHKRRERFERGEHGVICSFGAGYSIGSVLVRKV